MSQNFPQERNHFASPQAIVLPKTVPRYGDSVWKRRSQSPFPGLEHALQEGG
jgi:hypothetical protein